jgi:tRNA G18 (ribose-2'-O)-methylase SpoU
MVTDRYLPVTHHADVDSLADWAAGAGLVVVGVDTLPGALPLETTPLPSHAVLLFGAEGPGLSEAAQRRCAVLVAITQYGSTRSLNLGAAAAVAMHTWVLAHRHGWGPTGPGGTGTIDRGAGAGGVAGLG